MSQYSKAPSNAERVEGRAVSFLRALYVYQRPHDTMQEVAEIARALQCSVRSVFRIRETVNKAIELAGVESFAEAVPPISQRGKRGGR